MITLDMPHMALNAKDPKDSDYTVPSPRYSMWNTYNVPKDHTPEQILEWVAKVARGATGGKLKNLVVNCHGFYSTSKDAKGKKTSTGGVGLHLGTGFYPSNVNVWAKLKDLVDDIWIIACGFGQNKMFCSNIAVLSGSWVKASIDTQRGTLWQSLFDVPYGKLDDYEGKVFLFSPHGTFTVSAYSED